MTLYMRIHANCNRGCSYNFRFIYMLFSEQELSIKIWVLNVIRICYNNNSFFLIYFAKIWFQNFNNFFKKYVYPFEFLIKFCLSKIELTMVLLFVVINMLFLSSNLLSFIFITYLGNNKIKFILKRNNKCKINF